jgi:hypothetical protein
MMQRRRYAMLSAHAKRMGARERGAGLGFDPAYVADVMADAEAVAWLREHEPKRLKAMEAAARMANPSAQRSRP